MTRMQVRLTARLGLVPGATALTGEIPAVIAPGAVSSTPPDAPDIAINVDDQAIWARCVPCPPSSHTRRSKGTAVRIFLLLFVALLVGFYLTVGPDVVDLSGVRGLVILLAVLVLIVAFVFVT